MSGRQSGIEISDVEVDAVIAEFGGDMRAAIAALLHDLSVLAEGAESASRGYVRRDVSAASVLSWRQLPRRPKG
jgi:hypothetical protein